MGIRGLFSYVNHNPANFAPFELHNTRVVIDAENFINHLYRQSGLAMLYGGEYMDYTMCVRIFFKQLRKCRIMPIFLFDGCHSKEGSKRDTLLRRNRDRIQSLANFLDNIIPRQYDSDSLTSIPEILPKLTNQTFLGLLNEYHLPHLTCEHEADMHLAELALYLDCPVLSNDSDFFLFQSWSSNAVYRIIPLVSLDANPKRQQFVCSQCQAQSRDRCFAMQCSLFLPARSALSIAHPSLLPLLAVMLGNDVIEPIRLPPAVDQLRSQIPRTSSMSYNMKRIDCCLKWLSTFRDDIRACVIQLLLMYKPEEHPLLVNQLNHCLQGYHLNPNRTGPELSKLLGLPIEHGCTSSQNDTSKSNSIPTLPDPSSDPFKKAVNDVCSSLSTVITQPSWVQYDVSYNWPVELVSRFRQGRLCTSMLDAIYVKGGTVMRVLFEDFQYSTAIYSVTESMRCLSYSLLLQLENGTNATKKLCGLEGGKPVENKRRDKEMHSFSLNVSTKELFPQDANFEGNFLNQFFLEHLQIDLIKTLDLPKELSTLLLVAVLWFRYSALTTSQLVGKANSVVLAFLTCALATFQHVGAYLTQTNKLEQIVADLCQHYASVASSAEQMCYSGRRSCLFSISLVHQLNELQLIFLELKYLSDFLDFLIIHHAPTCSPRSVPSDYFTFLPTWVVFPSCRLIYWLSRALECVDPDHRIDRLANYWIPQLLHTPPQSNAVRNVAAQVNRMFSLAETLVYNP